LEQVTMALTEIISNAINALREKGGNIRLQAKLANKFVKITIKDNGPGISDNLMSQIFKQQVPSKSGLGLGLYLNKQVIELLGGKLEIRTAHDRGTTVLIALPRKNSVKKGKHAT
jgi:signal transduction histidine kinase